MRRVAILALLAAGCVMADETTFTDKTLVVWATVANLTQRGGSVLSLENPAGVFDGLVLGEIEPGRWMPGSNGFVRTPRDQSAWPVETAGPAELHQLALVYRGRQVTCLRDGQTLWTTHLAEDPPAYGPQTLVLLGLRHRSANGVRYFTGSIADARVYAEALTPESLAALRPGQAGATKAWAWWSFADGRTEERTGRFAKSKLMGDAKVEGGRLLLGGEGHLLAASPEPTVAADRGGESWPIYHLTAQRDEGQAIPFDPNGALWWKGRYHLMYIFQDPNLPAGGHCWGHWSSADLINWTLHPAAIVPGPTTPDKGIFSGNALVAKDGRPMICWFGIDAGVCVASAADDDLIKWDHHPGNPIVPMPREGQPGHGVYRVWDPYLWLEDGTYYCLLGGNEVKGKDTLYLMKSPDLKTWTPVGPFYEHPDAYWTGDGEDCSCPDFFQLGDKHVLLCISHKVGARCYIGRFDKAHDRFIPERHQRMNWPGGAFFAPESLLDGNGRRVFWAWVTDCRIGPTRARTGSGVQSLPRVMAMNPDGSLKLTPAVELEKLRRDPVKVGPLELPADQPVLLDAVRGEHYELAATFEPGGARRLGLRLRSDAEGKQETAVWYEPDPGRLILDMSRSTTRTDVCYPEGPIGFVGMNAVADIKNPRQRVEAPFALAPGEALHLRVFVDGPVIEVFANDRQVLTQQVFPAGEAPLVRAVAEGGAARLVALEAWRMAPLVVEDKR
ncbi:MAG: GH32 C-terminal domain-containing protein [Armatimonadetes bacterium]|nr:GH32 C-terminal domain-containing protein [Armatimonadota bacterium]